MILEERITKLEKKGNNGWIVGKVAKLEKRLVELERQMEKLVHQLQLHLDDFHNEKPWDKYERENPHHVDDNDWKIELEDGDIYDDDEDVGAQLVDSQRH